MAGRTMQREQVGDVGGLAGPLSVPVGQPSILGLLALLRRMTVPRCVVADSKDLTGWCRDRSVAVTLQQARTRQRRLPTGPQAVGVTPAWPSLRTHGR